MIDISVRCANMVNMNMKNIFPVIIVAALTSGCVSSGSTYTARDGYYQSPSVEYTRVYVAPRPHARAQKVCVWEDHYNHRYRQWVREERCHWR